MYIQLVPVIPLSFILFKQCGFLMFASNSVFFLSSQNLFYFLNQFLPMFWSCKAKLILRPMPQDKEVLEVLSVSFKCPCWLQTVAMLVVAHQLLWFWCVIQSLFTTCLTPLWFYVRGCSIQNYSPLKQSLS